jgi:type IV secretion system protein VirB5
MLNRRLRRRLVAAAATLALATGVQAQIPVIDISSLVQLIQQLLTMEQQLTTLENQYAQARAAYAAITGPRGMQNLLSGTVRNYLPPDWQTMVGVLQGTATQYQALSANLQQIINGNAYLSSASLAAMTPAARNQIQQERQTVATTEMLTQQALAETSARFAALQQLINAIPAATDEKGALDLQNRIQAEQGMLQNEQTKVSVILQSAQAAERAWRQQNDEHAIQDLGSLRALPPMGL